MFRVWFILLWVVGICRAVNSIEQDFTCPFDDHRWMQRMETSADAQGMRLDLKQLGDVVQPPTLPQCPKCKAVLFLEKFEPELVERLRPFLATDDFAQNASKYPSYFVLAQVQERLDAPSFHIAHSYLRASWQCEAKPAVARRCLVLAHGFLTTAFGGMDATHKNYANSALLLGELERRLEKFDAANARFSGLLAADGFKEPSLQRIIARQMELIAKKDSQPHGLMDDVDALISAKPSLIENSKPAPAGSVPVSRVESIIPLLRGGDRQSAARRAGARLREAAALTH